MTLERAADARWRRQLDLEDALSHLARVLQLHAGLAGALGAMGEKVLRSGAQAGALRLKRPA